MRHIIKSLILLIIPLGCASTPVFDASQVNGTLTPKTVIAQPASSQGEFALWGGTILHTQNLKDSTQIEILAYPLNKSQRPRLKQKPLGRFIALHPGFLEPTVYAQGQLLTVLGKVNGSQQGNVGDSRYTYAVITAEKMRLWSPRDQSSRSSFHIGIGIGF